MAKHSITLPFHSEKKNSVRFAVPQGEGQGEAITSTVYVHKKAFPNHVTEGWPDSIEVTITTP